MFAILFNNLAGWLATVFNSWAATHNDGQTWFVDKVKRFLDFAYKFQNGWVWMLTGLAVILGMFVDVADWLVNAFDSITLTGLHAPSGTIFAPTIGFSTAYGFLDAVFPLHEILSALAFLMPFWVAINVLRLTRAVLSLVQVAGFGVNN